MTGACHKRAYRDRIQALHTLARIQRTDGSRRQKVETRAYQCPHCRKYHLTSH